MSLSTLNFATLTVLSKQVAAAQKVARKATEAGAYMVAEQVTLNVAGTVNVGDDYEQRIVLKADPFKMLVVALSHLNGVTVDSIVREALNLDDEALVKSVKAEAKAAWETINAPTMTPCKGKVTVKGTVEVGVPTLTVSK